MHLARPHSAVAASLEGDVLVTLAHSHQALTGLEVARLISDASQAGVNRALRRLVAHGLVIGKQAGPSILHLLNRDHLLYPAVERLVGVREELILRMKDEISGWRPAPL